MKYKNIVLLGLIGFLLVGCGSKAGSQNDIATKDTLATHETTDSDESVLVNKEVIENLDYSNISNFNLGFGVDMSYYHYTTTKDITVDDVKERVMTVDATIDTLNGVSYVESSFTQEDETLVSKVYTDVEDCKLYSYMNDEDCWYIYDCSLGDIRESYRPNLEGIMSESWVLEDEGEGLLTYTCSSSPFADSFLSQGSTSLFEDVKYTGTLVVNKKNFNLIEYSFSVSGVEIDAEGNKLSNKVVEYKMSDNEVGELQELSIPKDVLDNSIDYTEKQDN